MKIDDQLIKIRALIKTNENPIRIGFHIEQLRKKHLCLGCIAMRLLVSIDEVLKFHTAFEAADGLNKEF